MEVLVTIGEAGAGDGPSPKASLTGRERSLLSTMHVGYSVG